MAKTKMIPASKLVLDWNLYPRQRMNEQTVADYVDALDSGATFPPVIVDSKSLRVVDGWKRTTATIRHGGAEAEILAELRSYQSEEALLLEAGRLNGEHGERMSHLDVRRFALICMDHGISETEIAEAMHMTVDRLIKFAELHHIGKGGQRLPGEQATKNLQGRKLTNKQQDGLKRAGGGSQVYFINRVIDLIECDILDTSNASTMVRLEYLAGLLQPYIKDKAA